jgi:hypothetical protein
MTKSGTQQIDLFTPEASYAPEWLQRSKTAFDPALAEKWKREKMAAAASSPAHHELLTLLRPALRAIALSRDCRTVTADDAQAWLITNGYEPSELGNAAGSIFRGGEWKLVGYRKSARVSRHSNRVGIWQLKENFGAR